LRRGALAGAPPLRRAVLLAGSVVKRSPHGQAQLLHHAEGDARVAAAPQRGGRAGVIGDAPLAVAEHQDLDELVVARVDRHAKAFRKPPSHAYSAGHRSDS
jgi:hypothetical protein